MRVGLVTSFFPEVKGGAEVALDAMLPAYARAGIDLKIFTLGRVSNASAESHVRVGIGRVLPAKVKLVGPPGLNRLVALYLDRVLASQPVDLLHVQDTYVFPAAFLAARKRRTPVVLSYHNNVGVPHETFGVPRPVGAWLDRQERNTLLKARRCSAVIPTSCFIKEELVRAGVPRERIRPAYVGGAVSEFAEGTNIKPTSPFVVVAAGRLHEHKGFHIPILAVSEMTRLGGAVELVIAGDGPFRPKLARIARDVGANVSLPGSLDPRTLLRLYDGAHVAVVPSLTPEPFGRVAVEAMSRGTAVVASDVGGLPEIVVHGETGYLVPPGDVRALAACLGSLQRGGAELAHRMGRAALARSRQRFAAAAVVRDIVKIYVDILRAEPR